MGEIEGHDASIVSVFREDDQGVEGLKKVRAEIGPGIVLLTDYEAAVTGAYSEEGFKTYILDPDGVVRAELGGTVRTRPDSAAIIEALTTVMAQDAD